MLSDDDESNDQNTTQVPRSMTLMANFHKLTFILSGVD